MIIYKKKKWDLSITRNSSFFHACLAVDGAVNKGKVFGVSPKDELSIVTNTQRHTIYTEQKNLEIYQKSIERVCMSPKRLQKLAGIYDILIQKLNSASNDLEDHVTEKRYIQFIQAYTALTPGLFITAIMGRSMTVFLRSLLEKKFPQHSTQDIDKIISVITYPEEHTPLTNSQLQLVKLAAGMQEKNISTQELLESSLSKTFDNIFNTYKFIPVNYTEEAWTKQEMIVQLSEMLKKDCKKELQTLEENHKNKVRQMKKQLKEISDSSIEQASIALQAGTILNEKRKFAFCRAGVAYRPLFKEIAEECNLSSWKDVWQLTPEEVRLVAFHGKGSLLKKIVERSVAGVVSDYKIGYKVIQGVELKNILKQIHSVQKDMVLETGVHEVKGMIASQGLVRGTVRIILNSSDFPKFKTGDILVTAMTSVDFVPLMKRAAAFVTNEGGVTSHASIVSRELNKPCIIGTKIATQVFKDGDVVEVDANKGVVRKI